jgi:hypothetical protein
MHAGFIVAPVLLIIAGIIPVIGSEKSPVIGSEKEVD